MAKGKKYLQCGYNMYAKHEQHQPKETWVIYVCRSGSCRFEEKAFERK